MKFSELSTDKALDVMCELAPHIGNIAEDQDFVKTIGRVVSSDAPLNQYGNYANIAGLVAKSVPLLLKNHRTDVYGILSIMNERPAEEIAVQNLMETIRQAQDLFQDKEFISFFKSSAQQGQTEQSVPSVSSPG